MFTKTRYPRRTMSDDTPSKSMIMEFATNSVRNTTVATANDDPYFEVVTRFWHPNLTKINSACFVFP
jgi:hypothetical protein